MEMYRNDVEWLVDRYGVVPPPWAFYGDHPFSMRWRMGPGEDYIHLWYDWWDDLSWDEGDKVAYFRFWDPPHRWLGFVLRTLWGVELLVDDVDPAPYFERTRLLGLGGETDYERDADDPADRLQDTREPELLRAAYSARNSKVDVPTSGAEARSGSRRATPGRTYCTDRVEFYRAGERYGEFSNFAAFPIELDGKVWPTVEHYFQAQKFRSEELAERIRSAKSPMLAARLGRDRSLPLRPDWEDVKLEVMRKALRAKFSQHVGIRKLLVDTGDAKIIEHTKNDGYWGDGGDGSGQNMLGRLLMELREALR